MVVPKGIPFGHLFDPFTNDNPCFFEAIKEFAMWCVIYDGSVKAFTKAVLPRATWFNIGGLDTDAT